jgi:hypothetical protein
MFLSECVKCEGDGEREREEEKKRVNWKKQREEREEKTKERRGRRLPGNTLANTTRDLLSRERTHINMAMLQKVGRMRHALDQEPPEDEGDTREEDNQKTTRPVSLLSPPPKPRARDRRRGDVLRLPWTLERVDRGRYLEEGEAGGQGRESEKRLSKLPLRLQRSSPCASAQTRPALPPCSDLWHGRAR